jgi:hypothetical protein
LDSFQFKKKVAFVKGIWLTFVWPELAFLDRLNSVLFVRQSVAFELALAAPLQ